MNVLLFLLTACTSTPPDAPEPVASTVPTLTVGSWNVEWLDGRAGEGRMPRTERDYAELARVVASAGADVWTFQEVADEAAVRRLVPDDWTVHLESRRAEQRVAWAIRPGLHARFAEHTDIALGRSGLRNGVEAQVAGVDMLAVHLKAGCQWDPFDRGDDCRTVGEQFARVEAWLDAAEGPAMVVGDFNRQLSDQDAAWVELSDGEPSPVYAPLLGAENGCPGARGRHPIDQVVTRNLSAEAVTVRQVGERGSSDHCPLVVHLSFEF